MVHREGTLDWWFRIITYIQTYTLIMLEIYRVAVELMYSRRAKINIYAIK